MPCYSIITNNVEIGPNTDPVLLAEAFKGLGYEVYSLGMSPKAGFGFSNARHAGEFRNGKLVIQDTRKMSAAEKAEVSRLTNQRYMTEVVKAGAKRFGWAVKQTTPTHLELRRRY